jgi:hypothetical protein
VYRLGGEQAQGLVKKLEELEKGVKYAQEEGHVIHVCTGLRGVGAGAGKEAGGVGEGRQVRPGGG